MRWPTTRTFFFSSLILGCTGVLAAQSVGASGTISGTVLDTTGAAIVGAKIEVQNPVSGLDRMTVTDDTGHYTINNLPFGSYHVVGMAAGFLSAAQDAVLRSSVPVTLAWALAPAGTATTVTVTSDSGDLVENTPQPVTNLDSNFIARIPTEGTSSGLSSLIANATPGIVSDSNGLFHPQGEHSDTNFSVDGQPITDQQSRLFSNQLSLGSIQSMQVISGVAPAEYGDKASLVVRTTSKSGLGMRKPHGLVALGYGSFGTTTFDGNVGFGSDAYGSFTSVDGINSGRFLDTPEFVPLHDHGNVENIFERLDLQGSGKNSLHLNMGLSRSWAQIPNQFDQNTAGQDQRQQIKSFNFAPTYTHLFNQYTLLNANAWVRQDQMHYYPSRNVFSDIPATLADTRRLTNIGLKADLSYVRGSQNIKGGAVFQHTPLVESFSIGITDPAYNAPCLDASGAPVTDPAATLPCTAAGQQPNPAYQPGEAALDLTRGGAIRSFGGHADIREEAVYIEDEINWRNWTLSGGVRADNYNGLSSRSMVEPRAGVSYQMKQTGTVLRGSYGKFFLTPYNENLIVSSSTGIGGLASNLGAFGQTALRPAKRNHFSTGFEQAFGKHVALQADYFWKYTDRDYDFDVILNTPLSFPIEWRKSKIDGYAVRINLTQTYGLTGYAVLGHTRARLFGPEVGGIIFNNPGSNTSRLPFRVDHDQNFQQTTHFQYQAKPSAPWFGFNWQYESGMVAGAVPYAVDTTTPVNLATLSADQQAQIELSCGGVRATLTAPLASCAPYQLHSPLVQIPAPGTENDDRNPPRVSARNLIDISSGLENLFHRDRYRTDASFTVTNLTNKVALYNFLSTFSGTHFVPPRSYTAQLTFNF